MSLEAHRYCNWLNWNALGPVTLNNASDYDSCINGLLDYWGKWIVLELDSTF